MFLPFYSYPSLVPSWSELLVTTDFNNYGEFSKEKNSLEDWCSVLKNPKGISVVAALFLKVDG